LEAPKLTITGRLRNNSDLLISKRAEGLKI
jgi:hypothetical protein